MYRNAGFGAGIYILIALWFVTFMFCLITVRTGHYIGKVFIILASVVTVLLISLPKGGGDEVSADFYDRLFVVRYAVLSFLVLSTIVAAGFTFVNVCLSPVETTRIKSMSS